MQSSTIFCASCLATVERCAGDEGVAAFGHYGGALATAIRKFKYEESPYLARPLGALAIMACFARRLRADVIIPVPLHPRRLAQRGYNRAALLGAQVGSQLRWPLVTGALVRISDTVPQAELSREARLSNVTRAFRMARPELLRGREVVIIDDVSTTGATLHACGERVLEAGATRVTSVVVARTISS